MVTKQSIFSLKAFLYFFNSTVTLIISFLPIYFSDKGLTTAQIGMLLSIGPFAALLVQPLSGYLSDKFKTVKKVLIACLIGVHHSLSNGIIRTNYHHGRCVLHVYGANRRPGRQS